MSEAAPGKAEVLIIHYPAGIKQCCTSCGRIHFEGEYLVGLQIMKEGAVQKYMIGAKVPIWCCGEQKPFFQVFEHKIGAEQLRDAVSTHMSEHGTTLGLSLIGMYPRSN